MSAVKKSPSLIRTFRGISETTKYYDYYILDVWGVLYDGLGTYPGAIDAVRHLKSLGKHVLLLSNAPNRSSRVAEKVIHAGGFKTNDYDHLLTSGEAAYNYMRTHFNGQRVYSFWDEEDPTALNGNHLSRVFSIDDADFIYGSLLPHNVTLDDYKDVLNHGLSKNLTFICGNPDRVVGVGNTLQLCPGTLAEWYEEQGGNVIWIGKPHGPIYEQAWEMLGRPDKSKILAVGDSLVTDVTGATDFGIHVIWNAIGIHWDEIRHDTIPDRVDHARVQKALSGHPSPHGLMHGFVV